MSSLAQTARRPRSLAAVAVALLAAAGLALEPRWALAAMTLAGALALAGARRAAVVLLCALLVAGFAGLRIDAAHRPDPAPPQAGR